MRFFSKLFDKSKSDFSIKTIKSFIRLSFVLSLLITVICQSLECHSFFKGITFIFSETYYFILNYLIVFATINLSFIFRRRLAIMLLLSFIWLSLGITNFILTLIRPTPLSSVDFIILPTTIDIIPHYLTVFQMILSILGIILIVTLAVYYINKAKKYTQCYKHSISVILAGFAVLSAFYFGGMLNNAHNISYEDVKEAYDRYGFVYCFTSSLVNKGIPEPEDFSAIEIEEILKKFSADHSKNAKNPNVIVVQLESFLDTEKYTKYTLTEDPIPNFHKICNLYGEGMLSVPSNGGGTVNTEFEILTGMNLEYFAPLEYPYTTILRKETCESAPFILDKYGYKSHAIHNHTGVFYGRNEVYPNLGFDTFTPLEYMQYSVNELGWAKDEAVLENIILASKSTSEKDFIFAVTVEGHGMYLNDGREDFRTKVEERYHLEGSELKKAYMYEYYCSLLSETDKVIGRLYDYVMSSNEDFVVILYGDHLPSIEFDESLYEYKSNYATTYTVFSNMEDFNYTFEDIPAYRLISTVFEELGIDGGMINMINRDDNEEDYKENLESVQYDMLYGNGDSFNGERYVAKETKLGISDIEIEGISFDDGYLKVSGKNFTKASKISVNGWKRDTEFIDSTTLTCLISDIDIGDKISVMQIAVDGKCLSEAFYIVK